MSNKSFGNNRNNRNSFNKKGESQSKPKIALGRNVLFYGYHPVMALIANKSRKIERVIVSEDSFDSIASQMKKANRPLDLIERKDKSYISGILQEGAVHQGIVAIAAPLEEVFIEDICNKYTNDENTCVVILDQVTDPHNVGAILRSAAAFNAKAVIIPERNGAPETGTLAKSASGCLELVPICRVTNLSRAMETLKENGFWCVGMDGYAEKTINEAKLNGKIALVMGAEGAGMRRLTSERCDFTVKLPISPDVESLNVSNATAIALYEINKQNS